MSRRLLAWLLAVPIVVAGMLAGHGVAWRIEAPDARERAQELAATGHGYSLNLPLVLGLVSALLIVALALRARAAFRGHSAVDAPSRAFALLPPLAFLLREVAERVVHSGDVTAGVVLDRTLLIGLLIQLPFGLLALLVARGLCTIATAVGCALAASARGGDANTRPIYALPLETDLPRLTALALGYGERGPPARS
jgi:hypothetical protein